MNKDNVLKVAWMIEQNAGKEHGFNMGMFFWPDTEIIADAEECPLTVVDYAGQDCGTAACIAGWAVASERGWEVMPDLATEDDIHGVAQKILDLTDDQAHDLFYGYNDQVNERSVPMCYIKQVDAIVTLRHLAKTGEVVWVFT